MGATIKIFVLSSLFAILMLKYFSLKFSSLALFSIVSYNGKLILLMEKFGFFTSRSNWNKFGTRISLREEGLENS